MDHFTHLISPAFGGTHPSPASLSLRTLSHFMGEGMCVNY